MLTTQGPRVVLVEEVTVFARSDCSWKPTLCSIKKVCVSSNEERTRFAIVSFTGRVSYEFMARCNRYFSVSFFVLCLHSVKVGTQIPEAWNPGKPYLYSLGASSSKRNACFSETPETFDTSVVIYRFRQLNLTHL